MHSAEHAQKDVVASSGPGITAQRKATINPKPILLIEIRMSVPFSYYFLENHL